MSGLSKSWLFVPGDRPDRMVKAIASSSDAVILDLEDAVAPAKKAQARQAVVDFLKDNGGASAARIAVRINPVASADGLRDVLALIETIRAPDLILAPKVEGAETLRLLDAVLSEAGCASRLMALIESPRGLTFAAQIAEATPRLEALMFGAADYAATLGKTAADLDAGHARAVIANAAAMAGLQAIDTPFFALDDDAGLRADCEAASAAGVTGKAAIHPKQVETINAAFAPGARLVEQARRILAAQVDGVGVLDGRMIDAAMVRWATRLLG